jgi:putative ABC transport system permease protein
MKPSWPFLRLAVQNLGRRPVRTTLLAVAVAIGVGAVFATIVLRQAIHYSMELGFSRMGADLLIVPRDTMVNLTPALLTVEPSPHTLDASLADEVDRLPGVDVVAPQRYFRVPLPAAGHVHEVDLVAFDPRRDFTVQPWVRDVMDRPMQNGDVLVGARREEPRGSQVTVHGRPLTVYGRLDRTGVGPFDRALFVTFATVGEIGEAIGHDPQKVSALLVRLEVGATPEQVRFALAARPEVKVVAGTSVVTSARQTLTALLLGAAFFTGLLLLASVVMVAVLFSAILAERRRELGLLLAIGARGRQVLRMILTEAAVVTGFGGVCGLAVGGVLLLLFRRSLGYHFESINVPLVWPSYADLGLYASGCVLLATTVGLLGSAIPAWRASRQEPYRLVRAEGH